MNTIRSIVVVLALSLAAAATAHTGQQLPQQDTDYKYVDETPPDRCDWNGRLHFLESISSTHWIEVVVEVKYYYQNEYKWTDRRPVFLRPFGKEEVGCTRSSNGTERRVFTILNARWYDPCEDR